MHESMSRLLAFSSGLDEDDAGADAALRAIGEDLGASPAVMSNWKVRGISKDGAIAAEAKFGCSVNWVLSGLVVKTWKAREAARSEAREALEAVRSRLDNLSRSDRAQVAAALRLFIDETGEIEGAIAALDRAPTAQSAGEIIKPERRKISNG